MAIPRDFPYKISGNVEILDTYASVDIAAGANAVIVERLVPSQVGLGWITEFGHGIDTLAAFVNSVFQIQINNIPVGDYANIQDQLGLFNDPRPISPIVVKPGETVRVVAFNNDAVLHKYGARLRGFFDNGQRVVTPRGF